MTKFIVGNCVGLIPEVQVYRMTQEQRRKYFSSWHILNQKDIDRGYFYAGSEYSSFDLTLCEHKNPESSNFRERCQTLKGKSIQPISIYKYINIAHSMDSSSVTTYLNFKGSYVKINGYLHNGQFYFNGFGNECYKAKVFVNKDGHIVGRSVHSLNEGQLRKCTNLMEIN